MVLTYHPHSHVVTHDRPKTASHPQWHLCPLLDAGMCVNYCVLLFALHVCVVHHAYHVYMCCDSGGFAARHPMHIYTPVSRCIRPICIACTREHAQEMHKVAAGGGMLTGDILLCGVVCVCACVCVYCACVCMYCIVYCAHSCIYVLRLRRTCGKATSATATWSPRSACWLISFRTGI